VATLIRDAHERRVDRRTGTPVPAPAGAYTDHSSCFERDSYRITSRDAKLTAEGHPV
jgi:hypothetical protein